MITVTMPRGPQDLRIKHFKAMAHIPDSGFKISDNTLLFLADFLGLTYNQTLDFRTRDIRKMTDIAVKAIGKMDLTSNLPEKIVLGKEKFVRVDPEKIGIGWHIDFSNSSITKDPVRLACLFYVQEGFNYSDVDQNGNIVFPISSRYDLFEQEFPLDLFIRSANFFLKRSLNSMKMSTVQEIIQSRTKNRIVLFLKSLNLFSGKLQ